MSPDLFSAEQEALRSLMELLDQAKKCRMLYERAHMAFPEPLKRVLGMNGAGAHSVVSHIPAPELRTPPEAQPEWVGIRVSDATPTTVGMAILRAAGSPVRAKEVTERIIELLPNVRSGSVANIGTRLQNTKLIRRTPDGWELLNVDAAGVLLADRVWGAPGIFVKQELASHRREAILHLLSHYPSGLQIVQIVDELRKCSWVQAPVNKDLLKEDMEVLAKEQKVRRRGNSKKWELVPPPQEKP